MDPVLHHIKVRDTDEPLVLDIPAEPVSPHTPRTIAELFELEDGGLVMVDIGWAVPDNPGHPFHVLQPVESSPGRGRVHNGPDGAYAIRPLIPQIEARIQRQWIDWRTRTRQELGATREAAREAAERIIGPVKPDDPQP